MDQSQPENHSRFLEFRSVPYGTKRDGELVLNRYSSLVTNGYEFPGAQAMLYAAGIKNQEDMRTKPQVGMKPIPALQEKNVTKINLLCVDMYAVCRRRFSMVGRQPVQVCFPSPPVAGKRRIDIIRNKF